MALARKLDELRQKETSKNSVGTAFSTGKYSLPQTHITAIYMNKARIKLTVTPPIIIINRCQVGFDLNSHGSAGLSSCSLSMLSSIIPDILTYPPRGSQPIPYSVSLYLKENNFIKLENENREDC